MEWSGVGAVEWSGVGWSGAIANCTISSLASRLACNVFSRPTSFLQKSSGKG